MDSEEITDQLGKTINSLIRLARTIKEQEKALPATVNDKPNIDELILENRILLRRVEEVYKWKLENYSTGDIERELVRRRKKMELQRDSHKQPDDNGHDAD